MSQSFMSFASHDASFSCLDRKSTRLNSSHLVISYAVFCLKKKKNQKPLPISNLYTHQTITSIFLYISKLHILPESLPIAYFTTVRSILRQRHVQIDRLLIA